MRWGIADVEAWLGSLEPRVIDAWLAYEQVEPAAFEARADPRADAGGSPGSPGGGRMLGAAEAARRMARRGRGNGAG